MPALPPDRPGAFPPAPAEHAAARPGCPDPPAGPRPPTQPELPTEPRPLPDPAAVRLCLIPDSAPPYDAEMAAAGLTGAFAPDGASPAASRGSAHSPESGSSDPPGPAGPLVPPVSPAVPGSAAASGPLGWPGQFAQVLAETLAGSRSTRQLVPWTTERARDRIQWLGPRLSAGQQPRVRRVVTFHPTADAIEMTVVVGFGKRVHALAVRLDRADGGPAAAGRAAGAGRWLCTAIEAA
jgi:Family of unknown function (DUF6459)